MRAARTWRAASAALALALIAPGAMAGSCTARDNWTGRDKVMHLGAGAGIAAATAAATGSAWQGFAMGAAVGVAKELADTTTSRGHCSLQDAIATAAGAAIGAPFGLLLVPTRGGAAVIVNRTF